MTPKNVDTDALLPKEVEFTKEDLALLRLRASQYWQQTDSKLELPHAGKAMTESEAIGMSWLNATLDLLAYKGLMKYAMVVPKLVEASSEPSP